MAKPEFNPADDDANQLLEQAFDNPAARLRLNAMGDKAKLVRLFLSRGITAAETGDERCSYSPNGTPRIARSLLEEIGAQFKPFEDNQDT